MYLKTHFAWRFMLWCVLALNVLCLNCCNAFMNENDMATHNLTRPTQGTTVLEKQLRLSGRIGKTIAAYFGVRIAMNIAFRNEKRLAGINVAKKLFSVLPPVKGISSKPYVITFLDAQRRLYLNDEFHPGYYVITDAPTVSAANGRLDRQLFPYSQELFPNMCRLKTCWQSFTVGQTLQPTLVGTPDFCHGQLLWYIGEDFEPHPIALDDHDRRSIFHCWNWMKEIIQIDKYSPGITTAVLLLMKGILAFRSPSLLPLFLLDQNLIETIGQRIKDLSANKNQTIKHMVKDNIY